MSKTLATIDTKAPIEIGLKDLIYSGPDVENLGKFYDEMGFKTAQAGFKCVVS